MPKLVFLKETGLSQRAIAGKLGISQQTVSRVNQKLATGDVYETKRVGRCGRKRRSSRRDDRNLVRMCKKNRKATSGMLKKCWESSGIIVSASTVRRRLLENGLHARRPLKKPKLAPAMILKRLDWAKEHQNWTYVD